MDSQIIDTTRILSVADILRRQSESRSDAVAVLSPDRPSLSYGDLWRHAQSIGAALCRIGLGAGDRVAIVLPNSPEMALAFLGVTSVATAAPLNPAYRASEFEFYLSDLRAKAVIAQAGDHPCKEAARSLRLPILDCVALTRGSDTLLSLPAPSCEALVLHTSGTTSRPKLVPLTHANLCHSAHNVAETLALGPQDRCLNVMPLFHIHGIVAALLSSLAAGGSVVATSGFDATRFFDWLTCFHPSWYTAVPTVHQAVLAAARNVGLSSVESQLRLIRSSSAALPPVVMAELESLFGAPVIEAYGMTEAAHQMTSNPLPPLPRSPGSVGLPAGPEVAIMHDDGSLLSAAQPGEVVIRGANVTAGYEDNPTANNQAFCNGWFRTGDQGYLDADGYLFLTGRLKEIINRGGEKISPREIDECLLEHPAVVQAVAFAVPHTSLGQDVAAAVVLRDGVEVTSRELQKFAAVHLAQFKVPSRVLILQEIPKGPTGKLQRIGLAEKLGLFGRGGRNALPAAAYEVPRTAVEERLAQIWAGLLGVGMVGIHDDFTQLGGDSLLAASLMAQVGAAFNLAEVPTFDAYPTVAEMAERMAQRDE